MMGARQVLTASLPPLRVDPDLKQKIEEIARKRDRSVSFIQRDALRAYLKENTDGN